jgi:hypothetical protein
MPIFTPAGGRSSVRQRKVSARMAGSMGWVDWTPRVDWTVRIPAPEEGSKPAIVRTVCIQAVYRRVRLDWAYG